MAAATTTIAHHPTCPYEYAWDVAGECQAQCTCPKFWPRRVCAICWNVPKKCACDRITLADEYALLEGHLDAEDEIRRLNEG